MNSRNTARRSRRDSGILFAAIAAAVSAAVPVHGATETWDVGNGSWSQTTPGNWNNNTVPGSGDTVDITTTGTAGVTVTYDYTGSAVTLGTLNIGLTGGAGGATDTLSMSANNLTAVTENIGDSGNGTFTQYGGDDTTNGNFGVGINSTDTGVYNMNGGTLSIGERYYVGFNGTGTVNQVNGNISLANNFVLFVGNSSSATGIYNLGGGTLTTNGDANGGDGDELIGISGNATFTQTGGINTVGGQASMWVASGTGKTAIYNLSAGTLNTPYLNLSQTSGTGNGTLNISGIGVANIGSAITGYSGSALVLSGGLLNVENNGIASVANPITTVELPASGQTAAIENLGGAGVNGAGLNMNGGGNLVLLGSDTYTGGTTIASGSTVQIGSSGGSYSTNGILPATGNIDDEGRLVFSQSNPIALSGAISGAGSVFVSGSGTTTLNGINTYSGGTNVLEGTLIVNGELYHGVAPPDTVFVAGASTLAGTGTIHGSLVVASLGGSGTIAPGVAGSTLSADANLTDGGGNLQFDVGTNSASMLALGGTANFSNNATIGFTLSGAPALGSVFTILTSTGLSGTGSLNLAPTVIDGDTFTPSVSGNDLIVTVSGSSTNLSWNNAGGATPADGQTWDIDKDANWNNGSSPNTVYTDGANVTFNDSNNATSNGGSNPNAYNVTLNTAVASTSIIVNNSLGNYTISGTGTIGGTGSLTKSGTGTLTLSTPNAYSGGTTVTAGKLLIELASVTTSALPTGPLSISGGTVQLADNVTAGTARGTSNVNLTSLSLTGNGTLDIGNNRIIIDYSSPATDPIASIASWIKNGFYNLAGPQIISSDIAAADAMSGLSYGIGYADGADRLVAGLPSGEIEIMFTLLGDANLDGTVNAEDFTPFSTHLGDSGMMWDDGDFNYDGTVNAEDFTLFSHNLGQSAVLLAGVLDTANGINLANVPEPACAGMMVLAGLGMLHRRRRQGSSHQAESDRPPRPTFYLKECEGAAAKN